MVHNEGRMGRSYEMSDELLAFIVALGFLAFCLLCNEALVRIYMWWEDR